MPVPPADPVVTTTTVVVSPVSVFTIDDAPGADDTTLVGAQSIDIGGPSSLPKGLLVSSDTNLAASVLQANPRKIATFARRFKARVVSAVDTGFAVDQMALWPNDNDPTWLIACNEDGPNGSGAQRINIASGKVEIIIKDGTMTSCDGVRRTPWGTVLLSEEAGGGRQGDGSSN